MGFTFDAQDFKEARRIIRKEGTGQFPDYNAKERIPIEKRWSARFFELDKIFTCVTMEEAKVLHLPWYHNISSWDNLKNYLGSENKLDRPAHGMLGYHEWNLIGEDNEE